MICFPLDNQTYTARAMGAYLGTRTRGVYSAENNLKVTANGDFSLTVSPGLCWFSAGTFWGACGLMDTSTLLKVAPADGELSRVDTVCAQLDKNRNLADVVVRQGAYSLNPTAPSPRRDTEYDELVLATVRVPAGATGIVAANLTDTRLDERLCGLMRDGVTAIPSAQLQTEYRQILAALQSELKSVEDESAFVLKRDYAADYPTFLQKSKYDSDYPKFLQKSKYDADYPTFMLKSQHETDDATATMAGGALTITSRMARTGTSYDVRFILPGGYTARNTAVIDGAAVTIASPRTLQAIALDAAAGAACRLSRNGNLAYIQADPLQVDNASPLFRRIHFSTTATWPADAADGDLLAVYT